MSKYLHKMSKEELIDYIEKLQECQLSAEEIDCIKYHLYLSGYDADNCNVKILNKLQKQKGLL